MMTSVRLITATLLGCALLSTSAYAFSVKNSDSTQHSFSIEEDGNATEHTIAPDETLSFDCKSDCLLSLSDEETWEVKPDDQLLIEDGILYFEGPNDGMDDGDPQGEDDAADDGGASDDQSGD